VAEIGGQRDGEAAAQIEQLGQQQTMAKNQDCVQEQKQEQGCGVTEHKC
jgi:hypothetical protein